MPEMIENRMVVDRLWENIEKGVREKLDGPGYFNSRTDVFVPEDSALDYMIEILKGDPDRAEDVMEYFYRNWIKEG